MPKTIQVGQTATATLAGFDQNGNPFPLTGLSFQFTASVPADVSFAGDVVTGVNADPGDSIGALVTRADGTVITFTPDTLTITAVPVPVLTTGTVTLS